MTAQKLVYIAARARGYKMCTASKKAGISKNTATKWEREDWFPPALKVEIEKVVADFDQELNPLVPQALAALSKALDKGKVEAIREVFDRKFGKARQITELTGADGGPIRLIAATELSDDELADIAIRGGDRAALPAPGADEPD